MPLIAPLTALSMSASAKTMLGDLPPSSSVTRFSVSAAPRMISLPTAVEPVNAILSIPGCWTIALPVSGPPVTMLTTPAGKPASIASSPETQSGERSLLGGLQHDGVAAGERRAQFPRREQQREIPRDDQPDDADRLAQRVGEGRLEGVDGLAVNLGRPARVVAQDVDHHRHIDVARFEDRLAVVERLEFGEFVDVLLDQIGKLPDQASALAGRHLAPWAALGRQRHGELPQPRDRHPQRRLRRPG